jgi:hypothetical protein
MEQVMVLRDIFVSLIRTAVPAGVGLVLAHFGINALDVAGVPLQTVVTGAAIMGYYALVRVLEARWSWVGVFLGWAVTPLYPPKG